MRWLRARPLVADGLLAGLLTLVSVVALASTWSECEGDCDPGAVAAGLVLAGPGTADPVRVLILTTFDLDEYVFEALRAGASGFLLKDLPREDLVAAVRVVAGGEALLAPRVTRRLIEEFARRPAGADPDPAALAALTAREREALELMARGLSNAEMATSLFVSEHTVKTHVGNVLAKLGLRDRIQAVILAYEVGLVRPGRG
jgi:DNA-binding NarL/FixJ family response regulator